ncbi:MAG: ABC transporter permease [Chitinophagaceae bacterium]|nr:ABC transporter permease [Chitinophagaceae bacterium]
MIKNYFKPAWRTLFKNKFHSSINIVGLVIGFSTGLMVLLAVYMQLSFDNFHANEKKLYQAYQVFNKKTGVEYGAQFGYPAAPVYKAESPAIDKASRFLYGGSLAEYKGKELDVPVMLVDEDFLSMFTFPVLKGNKANPLKNLSDIVITEFTAKKIFGDEDPVGKTFKASAGSAMQDMVVSAVVKDFPKTSTIKFDALARIENRNDYAADKNNWNSQHHPVFIQLKDGVTQSDAEKQLKLVNEKYLAAWYDGLKKEGAKPDKRGDIFATRLLPIRDVHFTPRIGINAINKAQLYVVLTVGLLIILIACFNFININLANAFTRSKEIGVRKCLGAAKQKLFAQLWSESFLVCTIAFVLSLLLINVLIYFMNNTFKVNMPLDTLMWQPGFLAVAVGLLLFVSLIAGGYPSWVMARFPVVETLKGKVALKRRSILRSSLIVAQFVIACIMISCTLIVYKQFNHLQNADLGINKEAIISIPLFKAESAREKIQKLRTRLASNPNILSVSGSSNNIGMGKDKSSSKSTIGFDYKDKQITTNIAHIDYDYLKTFGIKPIEGRDIDLSYSSDTSLKVILTESVAKQFGEKNLVGQQLLVDSSGPRWNVIAVIPDFHLYSMHEESEPLTLMLDKKGGLNYCFIKTTQQNMLSTMETIKNEMAILEPGRDFRGTFLDDNIKEWYAEERMMSILFSIAASIAILLSCLGLLAMVLLMIQQRVKEIGVRKVLGASISNLSVLISKEFLLLVLIAVLIATPIAWLAMNSWLQSFPYRISLQWWMFVLVGVVALLIAALTIGANTIRAAMQNPVKSLRTE